MDILHFSQAGYENMINCKGGSRQFLLCGGTTGGWLPWILCIRYFWVLVIHILVIAWGSNDTSRTFGGMTQGTPQDPHLIKCWKTLPLPHLEHGHLAYEAFYFRYFDFMGNRVYDLIPSLNRNLKNVKFRRTPSRSLYFKSFADCLFALLGRIFDWKLNFFQ